MKKTLMLVLFLIGATNLLIADGEQDIFSKKLAAIKMANQLAKYGCQKYSATALIEAAQILIDNPAIELKNVDAELTANEIQDKNIGSKLDFTPPNLLKDARKFANKDANVIALIDKLEAELKRITRGADMGPKRFVSSVNALRADSYKIRFYGGKLAEVVILGDGDTQLILEIQDTNGFNIASDTSDVEGNCKIHWTPKRNDFFTIKIKNTGSIYNRYWLLTN